MIRIAKSRAGISPRLLGIKVFDGRTRLYEKGYKEAKVNIGGVQIEEI